MCLVMMSYLVVRTLLCIVVKRPCVTPRLFRAPRPWSARAPVVISALLSTFVGPVKVRVRAVAGLLLR